MENLLTWQTTAAPGFEFSLRLTDSIQLIGFNLRTGHMAFSAVSVHL